VNIVPSHIDQIKNIKHYIASIERPQGLNVLYICGGIGMFAQALLEGGVRVANHIDIEIDEMSRGIASSNHEIDHTTMPQDLGLVTAESLRALQARYGKIDLVVITTPCQGLSRANKTGKGLADERSGLFIRALWVLSAVREWSPGAKYIVENVDFRDNHPDDYARICADLGEAEVIDAKDTSGACRKRLFWHNLGDECPRHKVGDKARRAEDFLDGTARMRDNARVAPCIMASWNCSHDDCKQAAARKCERPDEHARWHFMETHNPVRVQQDGKQRELRPNEAERLMGLPEGYSGTRTDQGATRAVAGIHRLQRIGGGVDVRAVQTLVRRLKEVATSPQPRDHTKERTDIDIGEPQHTVRDHVRPHEGWNTAKIAEWITEGALPSGADPEGWSDDWHMHGAEDFIRCCTQGFPLRYEGDRSRDVEQGNGKMCQDHPDITARELEKEVSADRIAGPYDTPPLPGFRVSPRGLKEEPEKFRPLTFGNQPFGDSVNDGIPKCKHIQLARSQDIEKKIAAAHTRTGQVWMAKADIKMAYRTMPVRPEDWHLQGIKWDGKYYIDKRMSFGNRASVDQWLKFSDALQWTLLRWGVHALHYVDDFIFIAGSEEECRQMVAKFEHICEQWGVVLKVQKDCGPAQVLTALGVEYDMISMKRRITPTRVTQLTDMLGEARTSRSLPLWEKITGVLWYVIRCVPLGAPHLQPIMEATLRARGQKRPVAPTATTRGAIEWWNMFIRQMDTQASEGKWHGEDLIPMGTTTATTAMGDAGSEWGMGGHDDRHYFKAKWTPELWEEVQREKSTSSLHMEALQLLVMARVMGEKWTRCSVTVELDSLGLVQTYKKGRHKHPGINAILRELSSIQMEHHFTLHTRWVRRNLNEAADALSKDDMDRFWRNVRGDRTMIVTTAHHVRQPAGSRTGGMRRTEAQMREWDTRPTAQIAPGITTTGKTTTAEVRAMVDRAVLAHAKKCEPLHGVRTGAKHYLRFCMRTGRSDDVAPGYHEMVDNVVAWMADAVQSYVDPATGKVKKSLSTTSIPTYLGNIDHWYAITTGVPRGLLQRNEEVTRHRRLITAQYKSANKQVHGITFSMLKTLHRRAGNLPPPPRRLLRAAHTLAWFALLRPTEYMLTPLHSEFDKTRHLRAGDITFWEGERRVRPDEGGNPDRMIVNVKQSKTDWSRLGAKLVVGATYTEECPVGNMWHYMRKAAPEAEGPLFPGLRYATMLRTTRGMIGEDPKLYGMHSFRVGGAQAMAMAGRSAAYIMGRGRWKHIESVSRYVEAPESTKAGDSLAMAKTHDQRAEEAANSCWGNRHTPSEGERLLPRSHLGA
jgi:site-specific DNA-cytosine methylase